MEEQPVQRIGRRKRAGLIWWKNRLWQSSGSGSATESERDRKQDRDREMERRMREEAARGFDLTRGPLIRGRLIGVGEEEHVLLITMHHIVSDGWSMGVLLHELSMLYGAYVKGEEDPLRASWKSSMGTMRCGRGGGWKGRCCGSRESTGGESLRERRRCWSCRRTGHGRRSRTMRAEW